MPIRLPDFSFKTAKNVSSQVSVEPEAACWKAPASPTLLPLPYTAGTVPFGTYLEPVGNALNVVLEGKAPISDNSCQPSGGKSGE